MTGAGGVRLFSALAMAVCFAGALRAAEVRAKVDVACQPTGKPLQYDCAIRLLHARSNEPLTDVALTVGARIASAPPRHRRTRHRSTSTELRLFVTAARQTAHHSRRKMFGVPVSGFALILPSITNPNVQDFR
jgi:hypothetical protein